MSTTAFISRVRQAVDIPFARWLMLVALYDLKEHKDG